MGQKPQARTGGAYQQGPNPYPGGEIDHGEAPVPPYEGRSKSPDDTESTRAKTESVERQMAETASEGDRERGSVSSPGDQKEPVREDEVSHRTPDDPHGVGTSSSRRGEDVKKQEGTESGRKDLGTKGATERPYGTSDPREDSRNLNPSGGS